MTALVALMPVVSGFGYAQGETTQTVVAGDTVTFPLYVFGDAGTVTVANTSAPQNWDVQVYPEAVTFSATGDYKQIETADGYKELVPADVTVTPPWDATNGAHPVSVTVSMAETPDDPGLTVKKTHIATYTINVTGGTAAENETKAGRQGTADVQTGAIDETAEDTERQTTETGATTSRITGDIGMSRTGILAILLFELVWVVAVWRFRK